jgi:hypothetical protein
MTSWGGMNKRSLVNIEAILHHKTQRKGIKNMKIVALCLVLGVGIIAILIYSYGVKLRVKEMTKEQGGKQ